MYTYKILWNPWRYEYIKSTRKPKGKCILCLLPKKNDEEAYIIYRGKHAYVVLNAYPYNSGHLMVVPYKHVGTIEELDEDTLAEMNKLVIKSIQALRKAFTPDGFNIGINIGRAAGAGIEDHVHIHIVPRWAGDSNFMAIIASTKTLPISLAETYKLLKDAWKD